MTSHPLIRALRDFTGNARPVVLTEPLWGIAYNLYFPFLSVYMLAVGLNDAQVGLVTSIGLAVQIVCALFGGPITDKLGRRLTNFLFDFIAWTLPCLIWAFSQNIYWFIMAAVLNSFWRLSMVAWPLLLCEDTDPAILVDVYAWIYIFAVSSALITPLAGVLINQMGIIEAMRWIFLFSAVVMTAKFIIMYRATRETRQGVIRREQTRHQSLFQLLHGYREIFSKILHAPATLFTLSVVILNTICNMISNTFWSIYVTKHLMIPPEFMSAYPFARAAFVLMFYFLIQPFIRKLPFRISMLGAYAGFIVSQVILVLNPPQNYAILLVSVFLEAISFACLNPQIDRLMIVTLEETERARIGSIIAVIALAVSTPFGWIGGQLSELNRVYPFILITVFYAIGGLLTYRVARKLPESVSE